MQKPLSPSSCLTPGLGRIIVILLLSLYMICPHSVWRSKSVARFIPFGFYLSGSGEKQFALPSLCGTDRFFPLRYTAAGRSIPLVSLSLSGKPAIGRMKIPNIRCPAVPVRRKALAHCRGDCGGESFYCAA